MFESHHLEQRKQLHQALMCLNAILRRYSASEEGMISVREAKVEFRSFEVNERAHTTSPHQSIAGLDHRSLILHHTPSLFHPIRKFTQSDK